MPTIPHLGRGRAGTQATSEHHMTAPSHGAPGIFSLPRREHSFQTQLVSEAGCASEAAAVRVKERRPGLPGLLSHCRRGARAFYTDTPSHSYSVSEPARGLHSQPGYCRQLAGPARPSSKYTGDRMSRLTCAHVNPIRLAGP